MKARMYQGLGAMLLVGSALLASTPGASAADDPLPVPDPPHLISAVVTGCQAPCAIGTSGDVVLTWERSPVPQGAPQGAGVDYWKYANDFRLSGADWVGQSGNTITMAIPICASNWSKPYCYPGYVNAMRGNEVMTITAYTEVQNPDYSGQASAESAPSNALVPTQG